MYDNTIKLLHPESIRDKIKILDVLNEKNKVIVKLKLKKENYLCPICKSNQTAFHGYYQRTIIHSVLYDRPCVISSSLDTVR